MSLHICVDRLADDLLETAQEALDVAGATEAEAKLLAREVVESLCMDMTETMLRAAQRILREHRREAA